MAMKLWNDLNENLKKNTRHWLEWAKNNAREMSDAGLRQVERRDLLSERKQLAHQVGDVVVDRFIAEDKKTVRSDMAGVSEHLERIRAIDARLDELSREEAESNEGSPADSTGGYTGE
jgi:predicted secreted Zn-dependent protease